MRIQLAISALFLVGCLVSQNSERGEVVSEIKLETEILISRNDIHPDSLYDIEFSADIIEVEPQTRHSMRLTFEHNDGTFIRAYEDDGFIPDSNVLYRWIIQKEIDKVKEKGIQAIFKVDGKLIAKYPGTLPE